MEKEFTREENPNFFKLLDLKCVERWRDEQKQLMNLNTLPIH